MDNSSIEDPVPLQALDPDPIDQDLDRSFFHGVAWVGGAKWFTQLLAIASTLIVARLLTPSDYGLVSMATVYLSLITVASEFGIGIAVVTLRDLTLDQLKQLNSLAVLLGVSGFILSIFAAWPLQWFFKAPKLPAIIIILSLTFIITSFQVVPAAILQREMQFKKLSVIAAIRGFINSLVLVTLAALGFAYWTLVLAAIISTAVNTLLTLRELRYGFSRPDRKSLREVIRFTGDILVGRLSWSFYANSDFAVAGRTLGTAPMGAYTVAWNVAFTPIETISSFVSSVMPAVFSATQKDYASLRRYILNLTEGLSLVTFPLSFGLALVAHDMVLATLGQKWQAAVAPLRLLAIFASARSITPVISHALNVIGETRFGVKLSIISVFAYPAAFFIGSHWGTVGIASAWMCIHPLMIMPLYTRLIMRIHLQMSDYLRALRPALEGSAVMTVAVLLVKPLRGILEPLVLRLTIEILTGAVVYIAVVAILHRSRLDALYRRLKGARG
jgi:teichuronic acid exporter